MRVIGLLLMVLIVVGCTTTHPLVGRWKTENAEGTESVLWFKSDGTFEALTKGETLPGKWVLNEDVEPVQLELIFEDKKIVTIAKLVGNQLLIEPREEDEELPTEFSNDVQKYIRQ